MLSLAEVVCWAVASGIWLHTSLPELPPGPEPPSNLTTLASRIRWGVEHYRRHVQPVERQRRTAFLIIGVAGLASFLLPWGAARATAWVKEGFREEPDT